MSTQSKTIPSAFATKITTLATNTTLGTSTRHDFAAITLDLPELTRTIRSVKLRVTARDAFTVATVQSFTGWRLGIKLGATAFDDVDYTTTQTSTRHETLIVERDVTAYFVTNFGSGATQTCQVGVAFSGALASNVNNVTAELWVTYDYDNTAATQLRCTEIPIQGHHTSISTSDVEIGTVTGASNAPANQIPILDTFCPEAGKVFKAIYLRVTATDAVGGAVTNFNLSVKLDSGTYDARATLEQTLTTGAPYRDLIDLTIAPYSITTSAVHALVMKSSLASTFECVSAVLVVVYTFTLSGTTREQHSVRVPIDNERSTISPNMAVASGDAERYSVILDIQEVAPTFQQSGLVFYEHITTANTNNALVNTPGQAARTYLHASTTRSGPSVYVRRGDIDSSTWALSRGINRLTVNCRMAGAPGSEMTGYAIINYTADIPATGLGSGNRSVAYALTSHPTVATGGSIISAEERLPSIPTSAWKMSGAWLDVGGRSANSTGVQLYQAERQTGEDSEDGWYNKSYLAVNYSVLCRRERMVAITDWVRQSSFRTIGMSTLATRRWRLSHGSTQEEWCGTTWIALHGISFTVAGAVTVGGVPVANGSTVRIYADDGVTAEYLTSVTTTGGTGSFTASVTDNTRSHFAVYDGGSSSTRGWSANGTPGTSTFDISIGLTVNQALAFSGDTPMQQIKQNTAEDVRFQMLSSTTGLLFPGISPAAITLTLCKKGETSHSTITPTITDVGGGWYNMALTSSHNNTLGIGTIIATASGARTTLVIFDVVAVDRNDAAAWGMSRLDVVLSTRASGTALSAVQTDTDDIQTRLPSALVGGRMSSDVGSWLGTAASTPTVAGVPKVEVSSMGASTLTETAIAPSAITATKFAADAIDANAIAASAVTEMQAGLSTSTALGTLQTSATDIQARLPATLDSGNIKASVQSLVANSITASVIATDAIDSDAIADSAVTEIQAATLAAISNVQTDTDDIQTRLPAALVSGRISADVGSWRGTTVAVPAVEGVPKVEEATLQADYTPGRALKLDNLDATVGTRATQTSIAALQADTDDIQGRLPAVLISGRMDSSVGSLVSDALTAIVDAIFGFITEPDEDAGARSFLQQFRILWGILGGKRATGLNIRTAGTEEFRDPANAKSRATYSAAINGVRTRTDVDGDL